MVVVEEGFADGLHLVEPRIVVDGRLTDELTLCGEELAVGESRGTDRRVRFPLL